MTPFQALYGRDPPVLIRGDVGQTSLEEVSRMTAERNLMLEKLKEQLVKTQSDEPKTNKHRRDGEY